jgi:hypothetical protein
MKPRLIIVLASLGVVAAALGRWGMHSWPDGI